MFKNYCILYKHDRFVYKRLCSNFSKITKIVCDHTGLSKSEAQSFLKKFKLESKNPYFMTDSFQTYQRLGFSIQDILEHGRLFNLYPREHEQHFWLLEEAGFVNLKAEVILRARTILGQSISALKDEGYIRHDTNVAECFLHYINNPEFSKKCEVKYTEGTTLTHVHFIIARQFLGWRFQTTDHELRKLYYSHTGVLNKSFRIMEENISIALDLGFSFERILKCGYIIKNYPGYPKQTLKEFPSLAGYDMRKAMKYNPTLVVTPTIRIKSTYEVLKEYNIPDEHIRRTMAIFQIAPETIRSRLEEIKSSPHTAPLLKIPRLLPLLVYHTRSKPRLPFLRLMKARCTNFYVLEGRTNARLERYMREGKDENCRNDVRAYFKNLLQVADVKDLNDKLHKHPYYYKAPLNDVGATFNYLIKCGFRRPNIYEVLWILLYPKDKVKSTLLKLRDDPSTSFLLMSQVQKLNTILYVIEKEHHFTGDGIFMNENEDIMRPSV